MPALALVGASLRAQTPAPAFEVASIRPAPPITELAAQIRSGKAHVGMSIDGARADFGFVSLADLIAQAYRIKPYQLTGPDWMKQQRFDVTAKIPDGVSKDQVPEMLQSLLVDRFKLAVRRETKELPVYALVVGKNGLKMKESPPEQAAAAGSDPPTTVAPPPPPAPGSRGAFALGTPDGPVTVRQEGRGMVITGGPEGTMRVSTGEGGNMRMEMSRMPMARLADLLTTFVDRPVVDMTELKGAYQVALELPMQELVNMARAMAPELAGPGGPIGRGPNPGSGAARTGEPVASDPSGASIFQTVQQLGLRLEPRKAPVETIVVDRLEKTPTEN
ncbi:MAG TPA: TIGR03435 family protein [Bryobacteraceae bacterium]